MVRGLACAISVVALACGSGASDASGTVLGSGGGDGTGGSGGEGSGGAVAPVTECPATFEEARRLSACLVRTSPSCTYEGGSCGCGWHPQCGGARTPDPQPGSPGLWSCRSSDPTVTRPDGCPLSSPPDGSACEGARVCDYTVCSWNQELARCEGGVWHVEHHLSSPPP